MGSLARGALLIAAVVQCQAVCDHATQALCSADVACLWNPAWYPNLCAEDPCRLQLGQTACGASAVTMPVPCQNTPGNDDFCTIDACTYDSLATPSCHVQHCMHFDKASCLASTGHCKWAAPAGMTDADVAKLPKAQQLAYCMEDHCVGLTGQAACAAQNGCAWSGSKCAMTNCAHHADEKDCDHDLSCHYDVGAGLCKATACSAVTSAANCHLDKACMWDASKVCVPKTCEKHNTPPQRCACTDDPDCKWHIGATGSYCVDPLYDACPDLDIAFVLDGSGSMSRSFGRHNHGFYGLMEIMRDWMKTVPLTGDDHTKGASIDSKGKGFRITFIQFSKANARPDEDHPTNCAVGACTDGHLSGRRDELNGDITWHENNYQSQWTYLHDALNDVADNTFTVAQSPTWRDHIVIIIADGGITDNDGDACCPWACGDRRCIDPYWRPAYKTSLSTAQEKLRKEAVTVFGIVMRRFAKHTFQDDNAQAKLTPLVTAPTDDHFMNLMLDEIPTAVLTKLCDPNSKFGKALAKPTAVSACPAKTTQDTCKKDATCQWDAALGSCGESVCFALCDAAKCAANTACVWAGDRCDLKPPGCKDLKTDVACKGNTNCVWDPVWAKNGCVDNPCVKVAGQVACDAHVQPMPACVAPAGDPDYCDLQTCTYTKDNKCEITKCLEDTKGRCETKDPTCAWVPPATLPAGPTSTLVGFCDKKRCTTADQAVCTKDDACKWDGGKCVETECAKHRDEKDCDQDPKCHMDLTQDPQVCKETNCAQHSTNSTCDADTKCMAAHMGGADVCIPKTCDKHDAKCPCDQDPDCAWHHGPKGSFCASPRYSNCPDLDIAFVLDGSGSMRRSFGRHSHGFYGLMEILRDWMMTVPLTGDDHTVGAGAKRDTGFRITFVQFSKANARPEEDHPTNCAIGACTNGLLSGRRDELQGDITWHENNYQAQWTYLHDALLDVADTTFLPANSPSWRDHVVIIIADGGLTDYDGDACCGGACNGWCRDRSWKAAYKTTLDTAQEKLRKEAVTVFGIVMRRFAKHTFQDDNAEAKLTPLVTEPKDEHFMNLMLDEIPTAVLTQLCDPNSKFGKALVTKGPGCAGNLLEADCKADHACHWDNKVCADSTCYQHCSEAVCKANAPVKCAWTGKMCVEDPGCVAKTAVDCKADATCLWDPVWGKDGCVDNPCVDVKKDTCAAVGATIPDPCSPPAGDPDFCKLDVCHVAAPGDKCEVKECLEDTQGRCEKDPLCKWVPPATTPPAPVSTSTLVGFCDKKRCTTADQVLCTKDDACKWDGGKCVETECAKHKDEKDCDQDPKCHMDLTQDPQVCKETVCAKHGTQQPCDADGKCMWTKVNGADVCVPKTCEKHNLKCDCDKDADCKWHHGQGSAQCVATVYDTCPDLDIAFVLDGSGSMSRSFGRHNHGFYGLMEIMRDWMMTVPLTGDDHTKGASITSKGKGLRMTFIQFSKANARPDEDHPMGCKVGQCSDGLLSGRRDELQGDITWHENNYQRHWTYLHDALNDIADHTFVASQSPSWRDHVVIIFADGGLTDYDGDACCPWACGDRRCMDRSWRPAYRTSLDDAQKKLRTENVLVLGVVIRRFAKHTFQDDNAQTKLTPLVTEPASEHFMNLMLDEIQSKMLTSLCDPNSIFGKAVKRETGCKQFDNKQACKLDKGCNWEASKCVDSKCYVNCEEKTCKTDPTCTWSPTDSVCTEKETCREKDLAKCKDDKNCLWDVVWGKDACVDNPCVDKKGADACHNVAVTVPTPCTPPASDPDYCKLDVCLLSKNDTCTVQKCLHDAKGRCEAEKDCEWKPASGILPTGPPATLVGFCKPKECIHTTKDVCEKDDVCEWKNGVCVEDECVKLPNEKECDANPKCHMNTSTVPEKCKKTECAKWDTQVPCNNDTKCMFNAAKVCVPKTCEKHGARCDCQEDPDCAWHHAGAKSACTSPHFDACPDMDIAFLIDGSGSMQRRFGAHAHGFYGMIEMMRDWVKTVPLTGSDHTVGATIPQNTPGMRVTFIQFSKADARPDEDHPTNCAVGACTDGLLSGRRDELFGDLDWHEAHYQSQWTYLHDALNDVADHTFLASQSPPYRQHVVVIIADGGLTDYDGDACSNGCGKFWGKDFFWKRRYKDSLLEGQKKLRDESVVVFGVVVRRFTAHTFADENAEAKLKPLISDPRDEHFMNVEMDKLKIDVLDQLCEKSSTFGKIIAKTLATCADLKDQPTCVKDSGCVWNTACQKSECYDLCTKEKCDTNPLCMWTAGAKECTLTPVTPAPPTPAPATLAPPTPVPSTAAPPTQPPATPAPPTPAPPTEVPATPAPPTIAPTAVPTPAPPVDECADAATKKVCEDAGQTCVDPDQQNAGDWKCVCPPPSTASLVGAAAKDCMFDECSLNSMTCQSVGQTCVDPEKEKPDSWKCECVPPQTLVGAPVVGKPAICKDPPGDCETFGDICHAAGQSCSTGATKHDQKVVCECIPPATGTPGQHVPAVCELNECKAVCPTCAQTTSSSANKCEAAGQDCEDLGLGHLSLGDWQCKCRTPYTGSKVTAPAVCELDECKAVCPTCASKTKGAQNLCEEKGQTCVEKSLTTVSDWECHCVDPKVGTALTALAKCEEDECRTREQICVKAGQACVDADHKAAGSWECVCPPPSNSTQVAGVAVCEVDECTLEEVNKVCADSHQLCVDTDITSLGNWECHCVAPAHGTAPQHAVASCSLDECAVKCPTCADKDNKNGNVCTAAGQLCEDPQPTHTNLNDWLCKCPPPSTKTAVTTTVADCRDGFDECVERSDAVQCKHTPRYSLDGCLCACGWTSTEFKQTEPCTDGCCNPLHEKSSWCLVDTADAYNKNKPHCLAASKQFCLSAGQVPSDGGRPLRAPIPGVPNGQTNVCTDVGQKCVDPDEKTEKDWWCECVLPKSGPKGLQSPAVCEEDECVTHGAVCTNAGQKCVDADRSAMKNWQCECVVGPVKTAVQGVAVCQIDECIEICPTCATDNGTTVCAEAGQDCADPNTAGTSLNDWTCTCRAPSQGTAVGGPVAKCLLDECAEPPPGVPCPTCAKGACGDQACEDPDQSPTSTNDWRCVCLPPSNTVAIGNRATCEIDECDGKVCALGQHCYDPDLTAPNTWQCECVAPATGIKLMGNATCEEDECKKHEEVCMRSGQTCRDLDKTTVNSWICECIAPDLGTPGSQKPAECLPSEECKNNLVCSNAGQHCVDPNPKTLNDWECHCIPPFTPATKVKGPAKCLLDECTAVCPSCAKQTASASPLCKVHGQTCEDPDHNKLNDWRCVCVLPDTGTPGATAPANCVLDECVATCGSCAMKTCSDKGQLCEDPNTDPKYKRDWLCKCVPPSTNTMTAGAVVSCMYDECSAPANKDVCGAGQLCVDTNQAKEGTWECSCPAPYSGSAAQAAVGKCSLNECTTKCSGCADKDNGQGNVCTRQDQTCVDPDIHNDGDWYCECKVGTGLAVGKPVVLCVLDECAVPCPTCADTGGGNLCTKEGQTCKDANTAADSKGDWECRCPPPFEEKFVKAGLAVCSADECADMLGGKVNGSVCVDNGQLCHDSHLDTLNDFDCVCPPPRHGTKTGAPAECVKDECLLHEDVCKKANQTCLDIDTQVDNNWECLCAPPSSSTQLMGAAVCEVDECVENRRICEGASPPQECVDVDRTRLNDWECRCLTPASGTAVAAAAACVLDECVATCATCEKDLCTKAGQTCVDPNTAFGSQNDWECVCPAPSSVTAKVSVAECPVDECVGHGYVCQAAHQSCVDPNHGATSLGDWECHCLTPATGVAIAGVASCTVDECTNHGHVCTGHGQTCVDPNKSADVLHDWVCHCEPPATQTAVAAAAECVHEGECKDPVKAGVCESRGQICEDPDMTKLDDWRCLCTPPSHGLLKVAGPAFCILDECVDSCSTCAKDVCKAAGQTCVDENKDPVLGLNTWECRCIAPSSGSKAAGAAVCVEDECSSHASTCTGAGQDCVDPSTTTKGDWRCECRKPSTGTATAGAAKCSTNECDFHEKTCADVGQVCYDPDLSAQSLGDWNCTCVAPYSGTQVGAVAKCLVDECELYGHVCTNAGQTCVDEEKGMAGFWKCVCPPPNEKFKRDMGVADCVVDECKTWTNTSTPSAMPSNDAKAVNLCEQAGQVCEDPNHNASSAGDWTCTCPPPGNRTARAHVATCDVDECADPAKEDVCAAKGQRCVDPNWEPGHEGDWTCVCVPPSVGTGKQAPAVCLVDECKVDGGVCQAGGQLCVDSNRAENGTWSCECVAHAGVNASQLGGLADCNPPSSECRIDAIREVCTSANQGCYDPDLKGHNDWVCECVPPATGPQKQGAATVCVLDECAKECPTCGKSVCAAAGQTCTDANTDASSLNDWTCTCPAPSTGSKKGGVAVCQLDECATVCDGCPSAICTAAGTQCEDTNTDARSPGDWECVCRAPALGRVTQGVPVCLIDECEQNAHKCTAGQTCADANKLATSEGDWTCTCPPPTSGTAVASAAVCFENECLVDDNVKKCTAVGQVCIDPKPQPTNKGDWECHCAQGKTFAVAAAAVCVLDECAERCTSCADSGGGNVCAKAGQLCTDPNTSPESTRDWKCQCAAGEKAALGGPATCEVDECWQPSNFGAHTCHDTPRTTVDGCACQCGWQVKDAAQYPGAHGAGIEVGCLAGCCNPNVVASGAWCLLEPVQTTAVCKGLVTAGKMVQTCAVLSSGVAPAKPNNLCSKAGQVCVDPDTSATSSGDWRCECVAPASGDPSVGKAGSCMVDECEKNGQVCSAAGQLCKDTDKKKENTWTCVCPSPAKGSATGKVAACVYVGECETASIAEVCKQKGQTCYDPDVAVTGNWVCKCVEPSTGVPALMTTATCVLDECTAECPTCADKGFGNQCDVAGQHCVESSTSPANVEDWMCKCVGDAVGESVASVAVCTLDECKMNNGRLAQLCGAAGQTCNDPNKAVLGGLNDWECVCPPPSIGRVTGKLATCLRDECLEADVSVVCTKEGQTCQDPNTDARSTGDWTCACSAKPGETPKVAKGKAAKCVLPPSSWCVQHGETCTFLGQACVPAASILKDGSCACIAPQTGPTKVGAATVCILDECTAVCATCADHGAGNVCTKAGQTCQEGSMNPVTGKGDWRCKCAGSDMSAVAAVAVCTVNECDTDPKAKVCAAAEQTCTDKNTAGDSLNDWMCACHEPWTGSKMLGAADCKFDECLFSGSECTALGQTCFDKDTSAKVRGDWECRCPQGAEGFAVAKAATCVYKGECEVKENADVCTAAGQTCVDPNPAVADDWQCRCVSPEAGSHTKGAVAVCTLDECRATCASCATKPGSQTHACASAEQDCVDPDTAATSIADWTCVCRAPAAGKMVGAAAVCSVDECHNAENRAACSRVKDTTGAEVQHCVDKDYTKTGDWVCECMYPYHGTAGQREAAVCLVDECTAPKAWSKKPNGNAVCGAKGQTCLDPQQGVASELGNWVCQCADGTGEPNRGAPSTTCKQDTLCAKFGSACGPLEMCVEKENVWSCRCIPPFVGEAAGKAASCVLDECTAECTTCAQQGSVHMCTQAGQKCVDHDKSPDSRSDWSCVCEVGKGEAALNKAECMVDECTLNGVTCEGKGQECVDPDMHAETSGDWVCQCIAPASGKSVAGPATCLLDECNLYGGKCTVVGQVCIDQNTAPASLNDWTCNCPAPSSGYMYAGPASCTYTGACRDTANFDVCANAGQRCFPGNSSADDFRCGCMPPYRGTAGERAPAQCMIDECEDICATCARTNEKAVNVCAGAGQRCEDPNLSVQSLGDWVCMCQAPSTTAAVARAVDSCLVDECLAITMTGARKCDNFKRYTNDGCECACGWKVSGINGGGPGLDENCNTGCCNPDKAKEGDWCIVADSAFNKKSGVCSALISKQKTCANERAPAPAGAPVSKFVDVCAAAGQRCYDPNHNPSVQGDWECHCTTSEDYHILSPAKCSVDECKQTTVCSDAGQACFDKDTEALSKNNWECQCLSGSGKADMAPAVCKFDGHDECQIEANKQTCLKAGQYCYDEDPELAGDWVCHCMSPYTQKAAGITEAATCVIDECLATCPTCARKGDGHGYACEGQQCVDPSSSKLSDWMCKCLTPAIGSGVLQRAVCVQDECLETQNLKKCTDKGQECVDLHQSDTSLNDWECHCVRPALGSAIGHAAVCKINECLTDAHMQLCHEKGQMCFDPDTTAESTNDWICRCPAPAIGSATMKPAECVFVGECAKPEIAAVCIAVEQTCVDTDVAQDGTWVCSCVAPKTGTNGLMGPAECGIDECQAECKTCEQDVCKEAGQDCYDPDVTVEGNWMCACKGGTGNKTTTAPAVCTGVVCATLGAEECTAAPECVYESYYGLCDYVRSAPEWNTTAPARPIGEGEDDDDCTFWECWWWLLLLLLLCCCLLLAFLLFRCRQKQQQNDMDDDKWNKQFQAEVDDNEDGYGMVCRETLPHFTHTPHTTTVGTLAPG